jgi:hypothetical protein
LSRAQLSRPVFVTPRVGQRRLRTKTPESHAESPLGERIAPPTIDAAQHCGHDSSMRTSSRRAGAEVEKRYMRFPRRALPAVFCTGQSGCESAQSVVRSSFRRPWLMWGCSRCERSPDTPSLCAASSRVVLPICALPPPWPRLWPCGGSGASTACEILHPGA